MLLTLIELVMVLKMGLVLDRALGILVLGRVMVVMGVATVEKHMALYLHLVTSGVVEEMEEVLVVLVAVI